VHQWFYQRVLTLHKVSQFDGTDFDNKDLNIQFDASDIKRREHRHIQRKEM
tara:strand:- start:66 stop:218 length:153 start_codon:yes stop_codon:yes gene_type:complete